MPIYLSRLKTIIITVLSGVVAIDMFLWKRFAVLLRGGGNSFERAKLTIICGFLTFIVLIGTPIKLPSSPKQFHHLSSQIVQSSEPLRLITNVEATPVLKPARRDLGIVSHTPSDEHEEEGEDEEQQLSRLFGSKQDSSRYTEILDWDEQRKALNEKSVEKILMVTGSQAEPCEGKEGDHLLLRSAKNKMDYCRLHGIELFYNMAIHEADMGGFWTKLPLLRSLMLSRPDVEWLWWVDSDALFTDMAFPLPMQNYNLSNLVLPGNPQQVYNDKNWLGLNTGSFLIRNCQWSLDLIDAWSPIQWSTSTKQHAGELLSKALSGRPSFEADDQSALVYLLATERHIWADKVYLENSFSLHGYWAFIVDRYEEMVERDEMLPLVTHFVGCKPCGRNPSNYPVEKCRQGMERALNFANNQIMKAFGFQHDGLNTHRLKRISQNPLVRL